MRPGSATSRPTRHVHPMHARSGVIRSVSATKPAGRRAPIELLAVEGISRYGVVAPSTRRRSPARTCFVATSFSEDPSVTIRVATIRRYSCSLLACEQNSQLTTLVQKLRR